MFANDGWLELGSAGGGSSDDGRGDPGYGQPEVAISTDGGREQLHHVTLPRPHRRLPCGPCRPLPYGRRQQRGWKGRHGAEQAQQGDVLNGGSRGGAREASGTGDPAVAGALRLARMERREPMGQSRQQISSTSRMASSMESAAAVAGAAPSGGEVALRETVERRGSMRSTDFEQVHHHRLKLPPEAAKNEMCQRSTKQRGVLPHETNRNQKPLFETVETRQSDLKNWTLRFC
jgi:hypothetical protein